MTSACRNPLQLLAIVILGVFQSAILLSMYAGIADVVVDRDLDVKQTIFNWLGCVFLVTSDQFIICSFAMVLMIPLAFPVYRREISSHMYSPSAYFWAATLSNSIIHVFYPLLVSMLTFWFYGFPVGGLKGFGAFFLIELVGAICGICFGQVIGSFVRTEYTAMTWLL